MRAFRYEAVDAQGKLQRGRTEAESARHLRDRLRAEGLFPTAIDAEGTAATGDGTDVSLATQRLRLPAQQVALATRQLATLVRSGMPLDQALSAVAEQADDARAAKVFTEARTLVSGGEPLAGALARWPRTFSDLYRGLVAVAAETGSLPDVLARLADYLEAREAQKQKFALALVYPALVTVIAIAVIVVLLVYVVPQIVAVYQQSRQTLPWLTQALIALSGFLRGTAWIWVAGAPQRWPRGRSRTAAWRFVGAGSTRCSGRPSWAASSSPWTPRVSRARSRSSPRAAPRSCARSTPRATSCGRCRCEPAAERAALLVREGVSLARALKEQRVFPPVLIHLTANGEASGQLASMLERAAVELEREAERRINWFAAMLQPALIVTMGAIVLVLVLAVMLPIVAMNQLIR